jgi:hypothetical protein
MQSSFSAIPGGIYGNVTLKQDVTIPSGYTLNIGSSNTLTIPAGITLTSSFLNRFIHE